MGRFVTILAQQRLIIMPILSALGRTSGQYFTSEVCTVSLFLDSYKSKPDVPICTAVIAVDLDDGSTILTEAGQGLYFGMEMDRSLLNPNQLRAFGVSVCDDPTDKYTEPSG